ncbi:DUF4224 domain-containing protein [Escherichia coli]
MNDARISAADMRGLTGYAKPSKQCEWLSRAGIWFQPDKNGHPSTTWHHVNNPVSLRLTPAESEINTPNFGAIRNGRKKKKSIR